MRGSAKVHLLFGMARSGSSFLARALETVPGVAVFGESDFFGRSYRAPGPDGRYDRRALRALIETQASKEWSSTTGDRARPLRRLAPGVYPELVAEALGGLDAATPAQVFGEIANAIARHTSCATVIEKTPGHLMFVERIDQALPDARCVASWREPAGFVRSFLSLERRDPRASMRMLGRVSRHTALGVLMWRSYLRALERARARLGSRLLVLSHAELCADPELCTGRAAAHFGLDAAAIDLRGLSRNASADPAGRVPADLSLWLRLLAADLPAGVAARAELPRTSAAQTLRSLTTVGPASALFAARVLPQAQDPLSYIRGYLGRGRGRDGAR